MSYIALDIEVNADTLTAEIFEQLETLMLGWKPAAGNLEVWVAEAMAQRLIAPLAELCANVADQIYGKYGAEVLGTLPVTATPSSANTTWEMSDTAGHTVPVGTQVDFTDAAGVRRGFVTVSDFVLEAGGSKSGVGAVLMQSVEAGADTAEIEGTGEVVDALPFVKSVSIDGASFGGTDEEEAAAYLSRLTETASTMAPRPILARDVEILARGVPGVGRALALDNYNPATDEAENEASWDSEKATTVAVTGSTGLPVTSEVKEAVDAMLQAKREVNFIFNVIDPTYNEVNVEAVIVERTGFSHAAAVEETKAAIESWLDPAKFGRTPNEGEGWTRIKTLRYQDLVTVVNEVPSVEHYTTLKMALKGAGLASVDITLKGAAPLTKPLTITVT